MLSLINTTTLGNNSIIDKEKVEKEMQKYYEECLKRIK